MAITTPGAAQRHLQTARQALRKSRQAIRLLKESASGGGPDPKLLQGVLESSWASLVKVHAMLAEIPLGSADEDVMLQMLSVQRYATALLVRLRRLSRGDLAGAEGPDDDDAE
jgi:hypothetical protein